MFEAEIDALVERCGVHQCLAERCGVHQCLAERGDIWAYATLVLHKSEAARRLRRRRVLQVDYSSDELPGGLRFRAI